MHTACLQYHRHYGVKIVSISTTLVMQQLVLVLQ